MNMGTKVRAVMTVISIIFVIRMIIIHASILTIIAGMFTISTLITNHWYNNDYTEEHCLATGKARQKKNEKKAGYIGEKFFDDEEDK